MGNISLELRNVGKIEGDFLVPDYQRGYRWKEEVETLLDDIDTMEEGADYCLQPVVVKRIGEKKYELIDGQQRLTTIFFVYHYIKIHIPTNPINFSIDYRTRPDIHSFFDVIDYENINTELDDIDDHFFTGAMKIIKKWFGDKGKDDENRAAEDNEKKTAVDMNTKFNNNVYVIWYEVDSEEDGAAMFARLNAGRIPLTDAELVRALILSQSKEKKIDETRQIEIANEWDIIERELHDDSFWYFITNEETSDYPTRIDLILDFKADKGKDESKAYSTFNYFYDEIKESPDKYEVWIGIKRYFQRLKGWYEDIDLYHKIGYLVASNSAKLHGLEGLINKSEKITKTDFQKKLNELIANSITFKKEYSELSFKQDYDDIKKLLLLFNVETIRQKKDKTMCFPFNKHKKENWSLEHIHAQEPQDLEAKDRPLWLDLHRKSLEKISARENVEKEKKEKYKALIQDITDVLNSGKLGEGTFKGLSESVTEALSEKGSIEYNNSLSNLALLVKFENSVLSNSAFDVKRDKIIEMDKDNDYIPVCTRNVFLKYYTSSESSQLYFWGEADRDGYLNAMNDVLKKHYLPLIHREIKI